jgi:nitrite reductase/ring-hydroxylating ferredoxin subunit
VSEQDVSRRQFFVKLGIVLNGLAAVVLATPVIGYLLAPIVRGEGGRYRKWINLGELDEFPEGQTRLAKYKNPISNAWDGETDDIPCWVRRVQGETFQVFAINCAHLGCPVRWFAQSKLFLCPCHGGAYYEDGSRASGPPERGLFTYTHKIIAGSLMIDAGKMPTLAAGNCTKPGRQTLTQIQTIPASTFAEAEELKPPANSTPGANSWPA